MWSRTTLGRPNPWKSSVIESYNRSHLSLETNLIPFDNYIVYLLGIIEFLNVS